MRTGWELFPHEADVGIRGRGDTLAQAFEQAALALTGVTTDPATVEPREAVPIEVEAPDPEQLLVDWLNALVREADTRGMLFGRFVVAIAGGRLTATAFGEPVAPGRHDLRAEVKAATYALLRVAHEPEGAWIAQCIVDV